MQKVTTLFLMIVQENVEQVKVPFSWKQGAKRPQRAHAHHTVESIKASILGTHMEIGMRGRVFLVTYSLVGNVSNAILYVV